MVAKRGRIEPQCVHSLNDWVHIALSHAALIGDLVAHRVAPDQRGSPLQPDGINGTISIIIVGKNMNVEVCRRHDPQVSQIARGGKGVQGNEPSGSSDKAAAAMSESETRLPDDTR
jgi:hypothetical protein